MDLTLGLMRVEDRGQAEITAAQNEEWHRLARAVHPPGEARVGSDLRWADLDPSVDRFIGLWDEDELRACAWTTERTILIGGREARVGGVRGVMTHPDHRRRGYGTAVMERAREIVRSRDVELALLFSSVMAVPFYEKLGWRKVAGPVFCDQPDGRIDYTARLPQAPVMALVLRPGLEPVRGPIDVRGLPW